MASMWHKAMVYLGLGPDDEYEEYDTANERRPAPTGSVAPHKEQSIVTTRAAGSSRGTPGQRAPGTSARGGDDSDRRPVQRPAGSQRSPERPPPPPAGREEVSAVRPLPAPGKPEVPAAAKQRTVVRPVPAATAAKPHVVSPSSFNNAQDVADKFKLGQPVVLNLQGVDRELARRLIDFSSGLCYGLSGHMEKVAHQAYLLTPSSVEVSPEDRRRLSGRS